MLKRMNDNLSRFAMATEREIREMEAGQWRDIEEGRERERGGVWGRRTFTVVLALHVAIGLRLPRQQSVD